MTARLGDAYDPAAAKPPEPSGARVAFVEDRHPQGELQTTVRFSPNVDSLTPSATLALAARARALKAGGRSIVDLSAGEPEFPTPAYASEAGIAAIRAGETGYPPTQGIPQLREAVATYLGDTTRFGDTDPGSVLVSAGVKQALFNCSFALFGAGDEVIVPVPCWPSYTAIVELTGATPVIVETDWQNRFHLDPDRLEAARTPRTRGLMVNSPGNPTGAVYDLERMGEIMRWCDRHGIWLLSDEIYRRLAYTEEPAPSVFDVEDRSERVILLDGMSKAMCMPGWRIGFAVGPPPLVRRATDLQSQTTSGAVRPAQFAAAAGLGDADAREDAIATLLATLRSNRERGLEVLSATSNIEVDPPEGAIYFYVRLPADVDGMAVAEALLLEGGVASIPGEPFGSPGFLRFNFAVQEQTLREGMERIQTFFGAR